jgi:hypothetical protein
MPLFSGAWYSRKNIFYKMIFPAGKENKYGKLGGESFLG